MNRREYLFLSGVGLLTVPFASCIQNDKMTSTKLGIVADVHADLMFDTRERLSEFIGKALEEEVDAIIQLGDFCFPKKENDDFMNIWNQFKGPKYHVLGNHDMDVSNKQKAMEYWEMEKPFYSFRVNNLHFFVLDANFLRMDSKYTDYDNANFYVDSSIRTFVHPEQLEWLEEELASAEGNCIILSHQSLYHPIFGIKNRMEIQMILENANRNAGNQKVIAALNGHNHLDFHRTINDIHYVDINSMSYNWLGAKYRDESRYPKEMYEKWRHLPVMAPYEKALYTYMTVDESSIEMTGIEGSWVEPSPGDLGFSEDRPYMNLSPSISARNFKL